MPDVVSQCTAATWVMALSAASILATSAPVAPRRRSRSAPSSAIFVSDADEEALARRSKEQAQASGRFAKPIVTEITSGAEFFAAEDYHQNYFEKIGRAG